MGQARINAFTLPSKWLLTGKLDNLSINNANKSIKEVSMQKGDKLVIVGCGGVGGPAAMLSRKLMPDVDVTIIRDENTFIVR